MPRSKAFNKLFENVKKSYLGNKVPKQFQSIYGKKYNKKEMKQLAIAIAKSRGIKIEKSGGK